jgi:hypothetical protein
VLLALALSVGVTGSLAAGLVAVGGELLSFEVGAAVSVGPVSGEASAGGVVSLDVGLLWGDSLDCSGSTSISDGAPSLPPEAGSTTWVPVGIDGVAIPASSSEPAPESTQNPVSLGGSASSAVGTSKFVPAAQHSADGSGEPRAASGVSLRAVVAPGPPSPISITVSAAP